MALIMESEQREVHLQPHSIEDLHRMWSITPITFIPSQHSAGVEILNDLSSLNNIVNDKLKLSVCVDWVGSPAHGDIVPSLDLVVRDLWQPGDHSAFDFTSLKVAPNITFLDFTVQSMRLLGPRAFSETDPLCGALNIVSSPNGLDLAALRLHPYDHSPTSRVRVPINLLHCDGAADTDEEDEHMMEEDERSPSTILDEGTSFEDDDDDDEEQWISVLTPPSAITQPHSDFYGASQYIIHITGVKLWFFWPATMENLEKFERFHETQAEHDRIRLCLRHLGGLETMLLTSQLAAFVVKPNTIHACMSFTQSAHTTHRLWTASHVEVALQSMSWGMAWIRRSMGTVDADGVEAHLARIEDDLVVWRDILESGSSSRRSALLKELEELETTRDTLRGLANGRASA